MIISAFAGTGKTTAAKSNPQVIDLESGDFKWNEGASEETKGMKKTQSALWPDNYVDEIERLHRDGKTVLTAMQPEVTEALEARGLPLLKVYPHPALKDEYMARWRERGNPEEFLTLMEKVWGFIPAEPSENVVFLGEGEFLASILD